MKTKKRLLIQYLILSLALCAVLALANAAYAQTGSYSLDWWTVDGGGGSSSGGGYTLNATIGQPDAGQMAGNGYTLLGGFWGGGAYNAAGPNNVYLPLITR